MQRLKLDGERGASIVAVAIMMASLLAGVGMAVDGGAVYSKKQQLQNGADAGAFAVAQQYALGGCTADDPMATDYARQNVIAEVDSVTADAECLSSNSLRVTARGDQRTYFLAAIGLDSMNVPAEATVEWGVPSSGLGMLPITISICSYYDAFGGSPVIGSLVNLALPQPSASPGPTPEPTCSYHDDYPAGGFNWLDPTAGCTAYTSIGAWVGGDTGQNVPSSCSKPYFDSLLGQTLRLPIFDDSRGTGSGGEYHIAGYVAYEFLGYHFNTLSGPEGKSGGMACDGAPTGQKACIIGKFRGYVGVDDTEDIIPPGPGDMVLVIRLTS